MGEVLHQVCRLLLQHARLGPRLEVLVDQPIDPALADILVEPPLVDDAAEIASRAGPVPLLDDPAVHVDQEHASVRRRLGPEWTEVRVAAPDELRSRVAVLEHRPCIRALHGSPSDQAAHRLGDEEVPPEVLGKPVSPEDSLPRAASHVVESAIGTDATTATLHVRDLGNGKDPAEVPRSLARQVQHPVYRGLLEEEGGVLTTPGGVVEPSPVILGQSPLPSPARDALHLKFSIREPVAAVLIGDVDPVIQSPEQPAGLVFHVAAPPAPFVDLHLLVGHPVAVRITVVPQIERVGNMHHHPVVERQNRPGEKEIVNEDTVLVVDAVAVGILVT